MMDIKALWHMSRYCMVLVLICALGLVFSPIALIALAEREKTKEVKKEAATKVCVVEGDRPGIWSFDQSRCAIVSEVNEDTKVLNKESAEKESAEEETTVEAAKRTVEEETTVAPEKISGLIAGIGEERAATKEEIAAEEELMLEITGLIIEETMTRIGYEFYEYFFLFWEAPEVEVKDYNILISERASPMWGSWVKVNVDETTVWSKMLRPRSEEIEDAVKQAIEATKQYLYNYKQYQFQTEDMVGTGI